MELVFQREVDDVARVRRRRPDRRGGRHQQPTRNRYAAHFKPTRSSRAEPVHLARHAQLFDAFTFIFVQTEYGWFQAHAYRFNARHLDLHRRDARRRTWRAAGLDRVDPAGTIAFCERLFAPWLDGHRADGATCGHLRGSHWLNFPRVANETWVHGNLVLMGDAAHSAHFSIGSGTKLALEDAIALARAFDSARHERARGARRLRGRAARSRCCASSRRRATRPNGSRTSRATPSLQPRPVRLFAC